MQRAGVFIAFEGGDGAGKSTHIDRLASWLRAQGHEVLVTRQPGGTDLGAKIRDLLLHGGHVCARAEVLLFAADKAQHVDLVIRPALEAGRIVLTDRYIDSALAYQGAGRELVTTQVRDLQIWAVSGLVPDLTVVIDIPPEEGRRRRGGVHDRLESEKDAFHTVVRERFLALAAEDPERYLVVDGSALVDEVSARVASAAASLLARATMVPE